MPHNATQIQQKIGHNAQAFNNSNLDYFIDYLVASLDDLSSLAEKKGFSEFSHLIQLSQIACVEKYRVEKEGNQFSDPEKTKLITTFDSVMDASENFIPEN